MNRHTSVILLAGLAALSLFALSAHGGESAVGATVRFNRQHTEFADLPLTDGDISFGATAEYHESQAFWQVGVTYTDRPGTNDVEFMVTPSVNLLFKDRFWLGGLGVLTSYIDRDTKEDSEWLDPYWQLIFGLQFPLGPLYFRGTACYVYESWDEITEFDFDELEFDTSLVFYF